MLPEVLEHLRAGGFTVEPTPTGAPGDATRLAQEAVDAGVDVVFAMGGDGTLREAAKGLLSSTANRENTPALGILPAGTTNVLSIALGLPQNPLAAAKVLPHCEITEIDVGRIGEEPFLMLVSYGLDAVVMAHQNSDAKKRYGKAAVVWTALREFSSYDYPTVDLEADGSRHAVPFFAACNIPHYGGAFQMAPDANPTDGLLDLVLFHGHTPTATLGFAKDLMLGRHTQRPDVDTATVDRIDLLEPKRITVQIDGDPLTVETPVRVTVGSERLRVLVPVG